MVKRLGNFFGALLLLGALLTMGAGTALAETVKPFAYVPLGVHGYDMVTLFPGGSKNPNDGELVLGERKHRVKHAGAEFYFANADNKSKFEENPEYYLPGAGGNCLLGLHRRAVGAKHNGDLMPPPGHPAARTYANGQWYFHGGPKAEKIFEIDDGPDSIDERAAKAVAYFKEMLMKHVASN